MKKYDFSNFDDLYYNIKSEKIVEKYFSVYNYEKEVKVTIYEYTLFDGQKGYRVYKGDRKANITIFTPDYNIDQVREYVYDCYPVISEKQKQENKSNVSNQWNMFLHSFS